MRKILLTITILLSSIVTILAQNRIKGTLKAGSSANSVIISWKPTSTFSTTVAQWNMLLEIPKTVSPKPSMTIKTNFLPALFPTIDKNDTTADYSDGFYAYKIACFSPASTASNWTKDQEYNIIEVSFDNSTSNTADVRLVHLPDGGSDGQGGFIVAQAVTGDDYLSDWDNGVFYGTGAVNGSGVSELSYVTVSGVLLPVNWLSFTASLKGSGAVLNWSAEEKNSRNFEITRSLDGTKFTTINQVASKGNGTNSYTYTDEAVTKVKTQGDIFYQLIQVDKDGKRNPSAIRTVRISLPEGGISVSPNPVLNIATVRFNHPKEEKATLLITDANGKVVYQQATQLQKGYNQKDINLSAISKGNYNLSVVSNSANKTIQLVKAGQ